MHVRRSKDMDVQDGGMHNFKTNRDISDIKTKSKICKKFWNILNRHFKYKNLLLLFPVIVV